MQPVFNSLALCRPGLTHPGSIEPKLAQVDSGKKQTDGVTLIHPVSLFKNPA